MLDIIFGWRKASECEKLMRKVQCRLKLLKNKNCTDVRHLRVAVFELLKHGHYQPAFNMVDQIYRDECMILVYEILDYYCEFIIIHLSYIRRHKDCPNDIKEAISSLIYASARCWDLPELRLIRKLFGERYGKRFAYIALELLPGHLVNYQMIKNLSITSVDDDVKYRLLDEIASNGPTSSSNAQRTPVTAATAPLAAEEEDVELAMAISASLHPSSNVHLHSSSTGYNDNYIGGGDVVPPVTPPHIRGWEYHEASSSINNLALYVETENSNVPHAQTTPNNEMTAGAPSAPPIGLLVSNNPAQYVETENSYVPHAQTTPNNEMTVGAPSAPPIGLEASNNPAQYVKTENSNVLHAQTTPNNELTAGAPSAPPIGPEVVDDVEKLADRGDGKKEDSSSCVICLDAPVEGACIPCGHMAGCMSCLNQIEANKWDCPVCRAKIHQVVQIYAV